VVGAGGSSSGSVSSLASLARLTIGGSVRGGLGDFSGLIYTSGNARSIVIGRDVQGGSATGFDSLYYSGSIRADRIASLTIGGSLIAGTYDSFLFSRNNGAILVDDDLGTVLIWGSILGNSSNRAIISARGQETPTGASDIAIGSLRVLGRVEYAHIRAGCDINGVGLNADAQIGGVYVGSDWIASSITAGAAPGNSSFGDADDAKIAGVKDDSAVFSKIGSLIIGGQTMGTVGGTDHFGIVAEIVGALKFGGVSIPTAPDKSNDDFAIGITGDFRVNEI
jgi:hypothetical protein